MEWISVEDDLPKPFTEVLVYPIHNLTYSNELTAEINSDGSWVVACEDSHQCYDQEINGVTHWMQLEPPQT